jgi:anti-sigma factor RsiW
MDHLQFKANQTAAVYVADGLDPSTQEAFEMHMMACQECVEDVETWRAVKINIPARIRSVGAAASVGRRFRAVSSWRMAATLLVGGVIGASGGWFGRAVQGPDLDSNQTVFFTMPSLNRGSDECTALQLSVESTLAVLRVPGIADDRRLVALDSEKQELAANAYAVRLQPDGSRLMRLAARALVGRAVHLETRGPNGESEPLGCITGSAE